jgi:Protein of unknown function (DUF1640)
MRCINSLLAHHTSQFKADYCSVSELENKDYVWKNMVQGVRGELQYLRSNDSANLKGEVDVIQRQISLLDLKFTEFLSNLKSDISIDMNVHKGEYKELTSKVELGTQELQHKLLIKLSNLKVSYANLD